MIFKCEGKEYDLQNEPTVKAVEQVIEFDQNITISYLDLSGLNEEDKKRDLNLVIQEQLFKNREKMAKYLAQQQIAEPVRTIMLCTGATYPEVQGMPLRPLFEKCKEIMGGTASDFFSEFLKSSQLKKTLTKKKL